MRPAGTLSFNADARAVYQVTGESLTRLHYSPYFGNPGLVVGSRDDATVATPIAIAAGVAVTPVAAAAGLILSPLDPPAAQLALAGLPVAHSGYVHRLIYVQIWPRAECVTEVSLTATNAVDAAMLWSDLVGAFGDPVNGAAPP